MISHHPQLESWWRLWCASIVRVLLIIISILCIIFKGHKVTPVEETKGGRKQVSKRGAPTVCMRSRDTISLGGWAMHVPGYRCSDTSPMSLSRQHHTREGAVASHLYTLYGLAMIIRLGMMSSHGLMRKALLENMLALVRYSCAPVSTRCFTRSGTRAVLVSVVSTREYSCVY